MTGAVADGASGLLVAAHTIRDPYMLHKLTCVTLLANGMKHSSVWSIGRHQNCEQHENNTVAVQQAPLHGQWVRCSAYGS